MGRASWSCPMTRRGPVKDSICKGWVDEDERRKRNQEADGRGLVILKREENLAERVLVSPHNVNHDSIGGMSERSRDGCTV